MSELQSPLFDLVSKLPVDPEMAVCVAKSCKRYVEIAADSAADSIVKPFDFEYLTTSVFASIVSS
jgi:hypothetical protein